MKLGVDLKNDFAFRRAFGNEKHPRILIHLLNSVLGLTGPARIVWVQILNPLIEMESFGDKLSILDIRVRDQLGRQYNIEMQMVLHSAFAQRIVYYLAKVHGGQLQKGEEYEEIRPTVSICFLDDVLFPDIPDCHVPFQMWSPQWNCAFSNDLQIHLFQLPHFQKPLEQLTEPMDVWLYLMNNGQQLELDALPPPLQQVAEVGEVIGVLQMLTQEEKEWALYEDREKARRDALSFTRAMERLQAKVARLEQEREQAAQVQQRTETERQRAESERERAVSERQRAEQALAEGQQKEPLIGQIRLLEQLLQRPVTGAETLRSKSVDELTDLVEQLKGQHLRN